MSNDLQTTISAHEQRRCEALVGNDLPALRNLITETACGSGMKDACVRWLLVYQISNLAFQCPLRLLAPASCHKQGAPQRRSV